MSDEKETSDLDPGLVTPPDQSVPSRIAAFTINRHPDNQEVTVGDLWKDQTVVVHLLRRYPCQRARYGMQA